MAVYQAGASIDERGKAYGGQAGNQTKAELRKRLFYVHSKGWYILRAKRADVRTAIAFAMDQAWPNYKIGYDQWQRYSLWNQVKTKGYNPGLATVACECDCSSLVATCVQYAFEQCGIDYIIPVDGFRTTNLVSRLLATGEFVLLDADKYCKRTDAAYNLRGDIACTRKQGHTIIVLDNGKYFEEEDSVSSSYQVVRRGDRNESVKTAQQLLLRWKPESLPIYGADSDFGGETLTWVKKFQTAHSLTADGIVGASTWVALTKYAVTDSEDGDDGVESIADENVVVPARKLLSRGDSGKDVEAMQQKLLKWNASALPTYKADGDFGRETEVWVKKFQTAMKIGVDGIVGPKTFAKLDTY